MLSCEVNVSKEGAVVNFMALFEQTPQESAEDHKNPESGYSVI
jgi:hypothetical protein